MAKRALSPALVATLVALLAAIAIGEPVRSDMSRSEGNTAVSGELRNSGLVSRQSNGTSSGANGGHSKKSQKTETNASNSSVADKAGTAPKSALTISGIGLGVVLIAGTIFAVFVTRTSEQPRDPNAV